MGEEKPYAAIAQRMLKELHRQQKEITWENVIKELYAHNWFDVYCPNPLKKFPEDDEIHINIKKRDIKFNFKN